MRLFSRVEIIDYLKNVKMYLTLKSLCNIICLSIFSSLLYPIPHCHCQKRRTRRRYSRDLLASKKNKSASNNYGWDGLDNPIVSLYNAVEKLAFACKHSLSLSN